MERYKERTGKGRSVEQVPTLLFIVYLFSSIQPQM